MTKERILFFEGAGCVPKGDIENCRIRTAFINNDGKEIYIELMNGNRYDDKNGKIVRTSDNALYIDFCHYITGNPEDCNINRLDIERNGHISRDYNYCKKDILEVINKNCNCDFTDMQVLSEFENYRVHAGNHQYNLMDNHKLNPRRTQKRQDAYNDMYQKGLKLRQYPCICVENIAEDSITFRFPDTDEALKKAGLQREYTYKTA